MSVDVDVDVMAEGVTKEQCKNLANKVMCEGFESKLNLPKMAVPCVPPITYNFSFATHDAC